MSLNIPPGSGVLVFERWADLRNAGRLDSVLPSCRTWSKQLPDGRRRGYFTLDYRVRRDLLLPGAQTAGRKEVVGLVETYWSVRTSGGVQDSSWPPSLNAHVVELWDEPIRAQHVDEVYRYTIALRSALHFGGIGELIAQGSAINLNVRGLLLGPSISEPAAILDSLAEHNDVPVTVARFGTASTGELEIHRSGREEDFFQVGVAAAEDLRRVGRQLIERDSLFKSGGIWTTGNENPDR